MTKEDLIIAIDKANNIFKKIMDKYEDLDGYLVLSFPYAAQTIISLLWKNQLPIRI
jgi:hypothetical protein